MTVYFLRPIGMEGPVKIGSSDKPERRLREYFVWSPYPLEIAATIDGGLDLERRFHSLFRADRTHHEWFRASPELSAVIAAIRDGRFNTDALPVARSIGRINPKWNTEQLESHRLGSQLATLGFGSIGSARPLPDEIRQALWVGTRHCDFDFVRAFLAGQRDPVADVLASAIEARAA